MVYFDQTIVIRVSKAQKDAAKKIVDQNQNVFRNVSHFARCGLLNILREYGIDFKKINFPGEQNGTQESDKEDSSRTGPIVSE